MKTARQRHQEWRETRLQEIHESIAAGTLVVRKMTVAERAKFPPRPYEGKRRFSGGAFR